MVQIREMQMYGWCRDTDLVRDAAERNLPKAIGPTVDVATARSSSRIRFFLPPDWSGAPSDVRVGASDSIVRPLPPQALRTLPSASGTVSTAR